MAQVKEVKGPGPRGVGGPKPKVENPGKLLKRIMDEVFKHYLPHCILVLVCIIVSALANVQASLFLKTLIDDYIVPMTKQATPDFGPLTIRALFYISGACRIRTCDQLAASTPSACWPHGSTPVSWST